MPGDWAVLPDGSVCLPTQDPLLCPPGEKAQRETDNAVGQLEYIDHILSRAIAAGESLQIRESHVKDLQSIAVEGIYPCAGEYRDVTRSARLHGGGVTHRIPEPALVPGLVREALDRINSPGTDVVYRAAYALWRFNWIHPFAGGNGRTARALVYLVFCVDIGFLIPGKPSFPTLIAERRDEYIRALREADEAELQGREEFPSMYRLVAECIIGQIRSYVAPATPREE
jgi:Fic family protein